MTEVDISNPDLLRNVDPIKKAVYDEEGEAKFHIGHLHEPPPTDLFGWADKERGKKVSYEMIKASDNSIDDWELDVKPLISSDKWLLVHGLKRNRLTMKQILSAIGFKHCEDYVQMLGRPVGSFYGYGLFQQFKRKDGQMYNITVGREKLLKMEEALLRASHLYKRRMQWLTTGSRRTFGVIQEHCICFVLDVTTMSQTQFDLYRECLIDVIKSQVSQLAKFNMIKAQADMQMWQEQAMPVTEVTIRSAIDWVNKLDRMAESSRTGCTEAILKAMSDDTIEAVYLFAEGDSCELSKELLRQKLLDAPHLLHTVSFNATKTGTIKFLKELAAQAHGRFHAFVVKSIYEDDAEALPASAAPPGGDANRISVRYAQKAKGGIPAGSGVREDVFKVWCELEECRNNYTQVQTLLTEIPDPKTDTGKMERPAITDGKRVEQYMSSKEWLERHGLEARRLTSFHILASCAFKHSDGVVDLKGKPGPNSATSDAENVRKLVNAKYCEHFAHTQWKDGTLVHVHITAEQHKMYEKRMNTALNAIQKRIDWLQQGSREVFGTILEEQVYILIDTSMSMKDKLSLVKEKLFQLMQEQLRHKNKFNIVKFDTKAVAWKDRMCDVTEQNLLNAWSWIKDIGVGGSTNTLAALRIALSDPNTHAIYLLTDGRPDQHPRSVLAQVQLQHPVPVHTISFNCNDVEANKFLYQLSADTGGRYHNFTSNGSLADSPPPFESEDVSLLKRELEKGRSDLEKISKLRARCVMLDWYHNKQHKNERVDASSGFSNNPPPRRRHRTLSRPKRPSSALVRRDDSSHSDSSQRRPYTSLDRYALPSPPDSPPPSVSVSHKNHRGSNGDNDAIISRRRSKYNKKGGNRAGHTRTTLLRLSDPGERQGWVLPETQEFMQRQIDKSLEAYQDMMRLKVEKKRKPKKKKRKPVNELDIPNSVWLKKHGLVARKLTVMDVLTPTVVKVKPKYIPVLNSHVVSKVFNDVLPIAHVSPRSRREIRLVNPAAVDLPGYDEKLRAAIDQYQERLDLQVWRKLSQEERDKFENGPVSYIDNTDALNQAFDRLGWPVAQEEMQLLVDEIHLGERYLQQSLDLQKTSKKVRMGRKRSDSVSSSDRSKSPKTSSSDESDDDKDDDTEKNDMEKRHLVDRLKGQKVIARDEVDGFYYSGMVIRSTDARHAHVTFRHGEEMIIPTRFIIQRSGAVSCPPLQVGDRVLAYSKQDSNVACYVPGIVIGTPERYQVRDKFYTVLKYDNTKTSLRRGKLVKISDARYSFAVRYIQRAAQIDRNVPNVDFVPPEEPRQPAYVDEIRGTLENLRETLDDNRREQHEQREILGQQAQGIEDTRKELKGLTVDRENMKEKLEALKTRDTSVNTGPMLRDISTNTDSLPSELDRPATGHETPSTSTDSSTMTEVSPVSDRPTIALDENANSVTVTRNNRGIHISRSPPPLISRADASTRELADELEVGQEVLARCLDDGWYYRGTVQERHPNACYDILDFTGLVQRTSREYIISDIDDATSILQERSTVLALHPHFPNSYAPGAVMELKPNDWFLVRFYDHEEADVPREDVYLLHADKYKEDVDYIIEKEKKWVGEAVVARSDMDGQYHLASCRSRAGNGHQYVVQWADGSSSMQNLSCIFGKYTKRRDINVGDCVLALSNDEQYIYLPGRVMDKQEGNIFRVNFCKRNRSSWVASDRCFWISKQYHDLAVAFYNSKQLAVQQNQTF